MAKRWRIHGQDRARIEALTRSAGVPEIVAQLLISRGIDRAEAAADFLGARLDTLRDPELLPGVPEAAERLADAIRQRKQIVIYGDYDADGMTGTAVLVRCIKQAGGEVAFHVPNRLDEGYGLNSDALESLHRRGAEVVVSVDCGVTSVEEAKTARRLGLDLIITDHHAPADELPDATVVVHPQVGKGYPFLGLSGSGVAFKLAWSICKCLSGADRVAPAMRDFLLQAVGLAAIGTVADVVPLLDENRVIVRHGLVSLKNRPTAGLEALMRVTQLNAKPALSSEDIAFSIAPRLNAAGRLGQAQLAIELLTTDDRERAHALAEYLHELNSSRESLERSVYKAAHKQAKDEFDLESDPALVLAGEGWHPGVIGIVAGRLAEKYHRPTVVIALDSLGVKPGIGSARSVPGFPLHNALAECTETLLSHGGHAAAAGLKVEAAHLDRFRDAFCELAAGEINGDQLEAELWIDAEAPFTALTFQTLDHIEKLAPFGHGNERPVLCTSDVRLADEPKRIGGGGRHLSMVLNQHGVRLRGVAFGKGDWADELMQVNGHSLSVAFQPVINHFRGRRSVELHVTDWQKQ